MATTRTYSGSRTRKLVLQILATVDASGGEAVNKQDTTTYAASGGTQPTITGWLNGALSVTGAITLLLAHATDPLQGAGDAAYSPGFTPAGAKVKYIRIKNTHASASLVASRPANGLPFLDAENDAITILAGSTIELEYNAGLAALTTTSNDALLLTPSTGTVTGEITVVYGD
ncbi:MAG: hypothetical protein ACO1SX_13800 [Actinomycetota bacterium]